MGQHVRLHSATHPLQQFSGGVRLGVAQQQHKFFPAPTRQHIAAPQVRQGGICKRLQGVSSDVMTMVRWATSTAVDG